MKRRIAFLLFVTMLFGACAPQSKSDFFEQMTSESLSQMMSNAEEQGYSTILITRYSGGGHLQGYELSVCEGETELEDVSFDENQNMKSRRKKQYDTRGNLVSEYVIAEEIMKGEGPRRAIWRYTYDENGNPLSVCSYKVSEDGTEQFHLSEEYVYDGEGNKISEIGYKAVNGEKEIQFSSEFVYSANDTFLEDITYYNEGMASERSVCHYNEKKQKVFEKSVEILPPGTISEYNRSKGWSYDDDGNLLREERYVNDYVESYIAYVYEREEGKEICNRYEGDSRGKEVFLDGYICEYNEKGELCKRTEYEPGGSEESVEYLYDESGRVVERYEYEKGSCVRYYEYEYR